MSGAIEATARASGDVDEADEYPACASCEVDWPDVMPRPIRGSRKLLCAACADAARAIAPQLLATVPPGATPRPPFEPGDFGSPLEWCPLCLVDDDRTAVRFASDEHRERHLREEHEPAELLG